MIAFFSQIIGAPVLSHESGELLALVRDIIINPDTGKIEAFWVKPLTLPIANAVIKSDSIIEWKKNIYIKDEREIAEASDIIRLSEILSRNAFFIDNCTQNEDGVNLGDVYDLDFDVTKLYLKNIYTQKSFLLFWKYDRRVFSFESIIKVLPEYILVKDIQLNKAMATEIDLLKAKQPLLDV